jgi:hypothetical protein
MAGDNFFQKVSTETTLKSLQINNAGSSIYTVDRINVCQAF